MKSNCRAIIDAILLREKTLSDQINDQGRALREIHEESQKFISLNLAENNDAIVAEKAETRLVVTKEMHDLKSDHQRVAQDTVAEISDEIHAEATLIRSDLLKVLSLIMRRHDYRSQFWSSKLTTFAGTWESY
jgi:hypothetical protein